MPVGRRLSAYARTRRSLRPMPRSCGAGTRSCRLSYRFTKAWS